jgi:hypothetical protein
LRGVGVAAEGVLSGAAEHPESSRSSSKGGMMDAASLQEHVASFSAKAAAEAAALEESSRKTNKSRRASTTAGLSAQLGEYLVEHKVKPNELVASWARRGEDPIGKMEFRQVRHAHATRRSVACNEPAAVYHIHAIVFQ